MSLHKPETPGQAAEWDRIKNQYVTTGLCSRCAAQAAYGHSHGFAVVVPPCAGCVAIVARFEHAAPNGWRKASRGRLRGTSTRSSAFSSTRDSQEAA